MLLRLKMFYHLCVVLDICGRLCHGGCWSLQSSCRLILTMHLDLDSARLRLRLRPVVGTTARFHQLLLDPFWRRRLPTNAAPGQRSYVTRLPMPDAAYYSSQKAPLSSSVRNTDRNTSDKIPSRPELFGLRQNWHVTRVPIPIPLLLYYF